MPFSEAGRGGFGLFPRFSAPFHGAGPGPGAGLVREWTMAVEECVFLYFPAAAAAAAALCRLCSSQQRVNAAAQKSSIGKALSLLFLTFLNLKTRFP